MNLMKVLGFTSYLPDDQATLELREKFAAHMENEGLSFGTMEEYEFRFEIFKTKDAEINYWNNQQDSYRLGHNMFSTMTESEGKRWVGLDIPTDLNMEPTILDESENAAVIDWRNSGAVNSVKNQGGCGSCWAFSATASMEYAHWKATKSLLNLSEQKMVDCDTRSKGCNGGFYTNAWNVFKSQGQPT